MAARKRTNPEFAPVSQARLHVEEDIGTYAHATSLDLKSQHNSFTPIGSLPPELLSAVLVWAVMEDYYGARPYRYNHLPWVRLAHVCRHFRAIALSTPRFWSYLMITKTQTFTKFVTLSKKAPLHVSVHIDDSSRADRALGLDVLLQHLHHLEELRIDGPGKVIQDFWVKTIPGSFDILERLELVASESPSHSTHADGPLAIIPFITADSSIPSRLYSLKLRHIPFRWTDLLFSSPRLTTLAIAGDVPTTSTGANFPDVGSYNELFAVLKTLAPRLESLEIVDALPKHALGTPAEPRPSWSIPFPSLKSIRLASDGSHISHLLDHLSLPSTVTLHLTVRSTRGIKELANSLAAHFSENHPLLSLRIMTYHAEPFLFGWTCLGQSGGSDAPLWVGSTAGSSHLILLAGLLQGSESMFKRVQGLELVGFFDLPKWANFFSRFPSVRTLTMDEHPYGDFFPSLMTLRRSVNGKVLAALPFLRVLDLSGFRCSLPRGGPEPYNGLLDWAIFRCNCRMPVDTIRLSQCKYASEELIVKLEEVVVEVDWDADEAESTEEEEESDEESEDTEEAWYGGQYRFYGRAKPR